MCSLTNNISVRFFSFILVLFARNLSLDFVGSFLDFRAILPPKVAYEFPILAMATVSVVHQPFTRS